MTMAVAATEDLPVYKVKEDFKEDLKATVSELEIPAYNPPPYTAPKAYRIGRSTFPDPLVSIPQVKAHLSLLRAFKALRTTVEEPDATVLGLTGVVKELPKDKRWTWFVGLAVER